MPGPKSFPVPKSQRNNKANAKVVERDRIRAQGTNPTAKRLAARKAGMPLVQGDFLKYSYKKPGSQNRKK